MNFSSIAAGLVLCCAASPVFSQSAQAGTDCTIPANKGSVECLCENAGTANRDECLALPPPTQEATNFIGLIGPILGGLGALGAIASGGSNTTTTTSTN